MEYNNSQLTGKFQQLPDTTWKFHATNQTSVVKHKYPLPNLTKTYHSLINLGILRPGWNKAPLVPTAYHVSAKDLQNPCPKNLKQALHPSNIDRHKWSLSYEEEYKGIYNYAVYDIIDKTKYNTYCQKGVTTIPTMYILTIKNKDGHPDIAKARIVVLGNQDKTYYPKNNKYTPVLTLDQLRLLVALSISKRQCLPQGNVKNTFCNRILLPEESVICISPKNCHLSKPNRPMP